VQNPPGAVTTQVLAPPSALTTTIHYLIVFVQAPLLFDLLWICCKLALAVELQTHITARKKPRNKQGMVYNNESIINKRCKLQKVQ